MRIISLSTNGEYEIISLEKKDSECRTRMITRGTYRMIYGDEDILLDAALMICDKKDYMSCSRNPVASSFNLKDRNDRYIYGTAVLAKLGKGKQGYEVVDFTDDEITMLEK